MSSFVFANPQIDRLFSEYDKPNVPGASVGVYQDGAIVYEKGYGLADVEAKTPATAFTNYRLASVSKQYTATAIMILIEQGKLSLDTKLTDVIPTFPAYGKKITIHHLLNHLSGLRDYEDLIPSSQKDQLSDYDVLDIYKRQTSGKFSPGSQYSYSNGGFVLLGLVVEYVTHMGFSEFLWKNVFQPLGMTHTLMFEKGASVVENRAYGYSPNGSKFKRTDQNITSATRGDGGVYTSVHEWLLWENAINNNTLVSSEMQKLAFTPGTLNSGAKTNYGFGWMLGTYNGFINQYHTGSTIGFRTASQRNPQKKLSVVVLVNRANSSPWEIAKKVADLFL